VTVAVSGRVAVLSGILGETWLAFLSSVVTTSPEPGFGGGPLGQFQTVDIGFSDLVKIHQSSSRCLLDCKSERAP